MHPIMQDLSNSPDQFLKRITGTRDHFSMEHRCLNGICFFTVVAMVVSVAVNNILGLPPQIVAGALFFGVLFGIYYYFCRFRQIFKPVYWLAVLTTCLLLAFPWFYNAGISGPTVLVALILISAVNLLSQNWDRILSLLIVICLIGTLLLVEYSYPALISGYPDRGYQFIDIYISFLIAALIISFVIHFTLQHFRAEQKKTEEAQKRLKASEAQFRLLVENAPDAIFVQTEGRFAYLNDAAILLFGASSADKLLGNPVVNRFYSTDRDKIFERNQLLENENKAAPLFKEVVQKIDGSPVDVEMASVPLQFQGKAGALVFARDISERKAAEKNLERQHRLMQTILENIPFGCIYTDASTGNILMYNRPAESILKHSATLPATQLTADGYGALHEDGTLFSPHDYPVVQVLKEKKPVEQKITDYRTGDGTVIKLKHAAFPIWNPDDQLSGVINLFEDITAQLEAEAKQRKLEMQLHQAQKMESIGRLAGGVAHDFNNLLSIINGYCELILPGLNPDATLHVRISKILAAGQRAAELVGQLLAFSRKQVLSPKILDINALFRDTEKMLNRLIGEDVMLSTSYARDLKNIKADPGQIEQVLINLAINARDAMPNGGKLFIETRNIYVDEEYARTNTDTPAGQYVMIAVSDTGEGMDSETLGSIFDPFFTTKPVDKGTGLGLSTVYGTIKQSGGAVRVYSEPGQGTTFKIYLPTTDEIPSDEKPAPESRKLFEGSETIMVVEDEETVMELIVTALERHGYKVIPKANSNDALDFISGGCEPIHLLLTDVVMPELNGRQLAEKATKKIPDLRVIYMSGYTENAIAHHGVIDDGINFLQKPIMMRDLIEAVRNVLDRA